MAHLIAELLVHGKHDQELAAHIPRYYLDMLNYQEIKGSSLAARQSRYKSSLIGTYGAYKGYKIEARIEEQLVAIQEQYHIPYGKGRSMLIETDIDFAIPSIEDPYVVIMSSFQETTSSGQTTKAKDMRQVYYRAGLRAKQSS